MNDEMSDGRTSKTAVSGKPIEGLLKAHDDIMNADVRRLCGVSATANRIPAHLASAVQKD